MTQKTTRRKFQTLRACLALLAIEYAAGKAGPFPEIIARPDTGAPKPGVIIMAGPTNYKNIEDIQWSLREYGVKADSARAETTSDAEAILRSWGYNPDELYWESR